MNWNYRLYALKGNALNSTGEAKMLAEDAALQVHPSCIQLREFWHALSVLERAVHIHRLAIKFKKTAIARNIGRDEGTVRRYAAVARLSSYWKCQIHARASYDRILKAAKADPQPDLPPELAAPAAKPETQVSQNVTPGSAANPSRTLRPDVIRPAQVNVREPVRPSGSGQVDTPVQTETNLSRRPERSCPAPASQTRGGHQNVQPPNGSFHAQPNARGRYAHARPKTRWDWKLGHERQRLEQLINFCHPQSGAKIELERQLAELSSREKTSDQGTS